MRLRLSNAEDPDRSPVVEVVAEGASADACLPIVTLPERSAVLRAHPGMWRAALPKIRPCLRLADVS